MEIKSLFENNLHYINGEKVGVIFDKNYQHIVNLIIEYCRGNNLDVVPELIKYESGDTLSFNVKKQFLCKSPEIIILALKENIWHTPERKKAKYEKKKRILNILHPDEPCASYLADINSMRLLGRQLYELFCESEKMRIFSDSGTDLEAKVGKVFCENGDYTMPSSGGDFPAGEVGFGPKEGSVNGKLVYDFKIQHIGFVKDKYHILEVKNDIVSILSSSQKFKDLLNLENILKFISEISIGINPIWAEVKNKESIVEEKNSGTAHFGHGGNLSYGNRRGRHFDSVILHPTIYLDNCLIMSKGKFNEKYISL